MRRQALNHIDIQRLVDKFEMAVRRREAISWGREGISRVLDKKAERELKEARRDFLDFCYKLKDAVKGDSDGQGSES